jgi:probable HAF family extracellular repeat protein
MTGMRDMGTLRGTTSDAVALNDLGQATGSATTPGNVQTHAFRWSSTTGMRDLGTLGGTFAGGTAINAAGQIAGSSSTLASQAQGLFHAFLWTP